MANLSKSSGKWRAELDEYLEVYEFLRHCCTCFVTETTELRYILGESEKSLKPCVKMSRGI